MTIFIYVGLFLVNFSLVSGTYSQVLKSTACIGSNGTCSPTWCARVSNAACVDPLFGNTIEITGPSNVPCKVCTQSTSSRCPADYLNSVLMKSGGFLAAYCNDEYLIIISTGKANHKDWLNLIPRPPGAGYLPYEQLCVTRTYHEQVAMFKIPLYPELLSTAQASNNLAYYDGQTDPAAIPDMGLPESGPASVSVSGLSIFPLYNNMKQIAMSSCEVDKCNAHAGQGFDYHYHGDPYHPTPGTCMYSPANYSSPTAHPPLIGWSLDGFNVHGRHLTMYNLGFNTSLDVCGGHSHNAEDGVTAMQYHYHAQVINMTTSGGKPYQVYSPGVLDCFRGNFTKNRHYFGNSVGTQSRPDYELLKPCCGSTEYVQQKGYVINTVMPSTKPTKSPVSPTTTPTVKPTATPSFKPTATPSFKPTATPSFKPTVTPSAVPTVTPTMGLTSTIPTRKPSAAPKSSAAVLSFNVNVALPGMSVDTFTEAEQNSIVTATAQSMGISEQFVKYGSSVATVNTRRLSTYTIAATTEVAIPMDHYPINTKTVELYTSLISTLNNAVSSSAFVDYLSAASVVNGATTTLNVGAVSTVVSPMTIISPPTLAPSASPNVNSEADAVSGKVNNTTIIAIAVGAFLLLSVAVMYFMYVRRKQLVQLDFVRRGLGSVTLQDTVATKSPMKHTNDDIEA